MLVDYKVETNLPEKLSHCVHSMFCVPHETAVALTCLVIMLLQGKMYRSGILSNL